MKYWLVKQEPEAYSFDDLVKDGKTDWTGVRNFQARNNLQEMKKGDKVLFYHSVSEKSVVGQAKVSKTAFPDPTDDKWLAVQIAADKKFKKPVTLQSIKANSALGNISLIKQSRLSVMPLTDDEYQELVSMTK